MYLGNLADHIDNTANTKREKNYKLKKENKSTPEQVNNVNKLKFIAWLNALAKSLLQCLREQSSDN